MKMSDSRISTIIQRRKICQFSLCLTLASGVLFNCTEPVLAQTSPSVSNSQMQAESASTLTESKNDKRIENVNSFAKLRQKQQNAYDVAKRLAEENAAKNGTKFSDKQFDKEYQSAQLSKRYFFD